MMKLCLCYCHDTDETLNCGTDVANVIDAVIACSLCINAHCPALLDPPEPPPRPRIIERTSEERAAAWELYLRQLRARNP